MNATQSHLQALIQEIRKQSPKTLAYWRLSNPAIVQALESFAAGASGGANESSSLLAETQALFDKLNPLLAQQEAESPTFLQERRRITSVASNTLDNAKVVSIALVIGGKYSDSPRSISELLVSTLAERCTRVFTVSRTPLEASTLPSNVTHMVRHHLDDAADQGAMGVQEFQEILQQATATWNEEVATRIIPTEFVIYFTLGQHTGDNPFSRNLQAAYNFAAALMDPSSFVIVPRPDDNDPQQHAWKVVLTGTDATLPSTYPDGHISLPVSEDDNNDTDAVFDLTIPTYKIMPYNYTYAMSKLGQYYTVAMAVARRLQKHNVVETCTPIMDKIRQHVQAAGEDGDYHADSAIVTMAELDDISAQVPARLLQPLQEPSTGQRYLQIAQGISICYTPLHAKPWTEQAIQQLQQEQTAAADDDDDDADDRASKAKAYVLEQIVKRFKNAVSLEHAVACHLVS